MKIQLKMSIFCYFLDLTKFKKNVDQELKLALLGALKVLVLFKLKKQRFA